LGRYGGDLAFKRKFGNPQRPLAEDFVEGQIEKLGALGIEKRVEG